MYYKHRRFGGLMGRRRSQLTLDDTISGVVKAGMMHIVAISSILDVRLSESGQDCQSARLLIAWMVGLIVSL